MLHSINNSLGGTQLPTYTRILRWTYAYFALSFLMRIYYLLKEMCLPTRKKKHENLVELVWHERTLLYIYALCCWHSPQATRTLKRICGSYKQQACQKKRQSTPCTSYLPIGYNVVYNVFRWNHIFIKSRVIKHF